MLKKIKMIVVLLGLVFVSFGFNFIFAEEITPPLPVDIHMKIIDGESSFFDSDISVSACDSDNISDTGDIATPYCAILQSGVSSDWDWTWAPGAFVTSINDVSGYTSQDNDGNDVYHYWSWSLNGNEAVDGLNQYELQSGDSILLEFIDPALPVEEVEEIEEPVRSSRGSSGSYIKTPEKKVFSVPKALGFLSQYQKPDGSFGNSLYTDWVAVGVAKAGNEAETIKNKLYDYLKNYELQSQIATDNERHAMALMSLGINPYTGTKINYIKKITDSFDGNQIGDGESFNDDIFALIVLNKTGYTKDDEIISKIISFVISKQSSDGSWGSVDMTAVAIQALENFKESIGVPESISKGESYLLTKQKEDGSFGNSFSTSWVIQTLSINDSYDFEINKTIEYFSNEQQEDGGLEKDGEIENRIWATSYAIPAVLQLPWFIILESFEKEKIEIIPIVSKDKENSLIKIKKENVLEIKNNEKILNQEKGPTNLLQASAGEIEQIDIEKSPLIKRIFSWFISLF